MKMFIKNVKFGCLWVYVFFGFIIFSATIQAQGYFSVRDAEIITKSITTTATLVTSNIIGVWDISSDQDLWVNYKGDTGAAIDSQTFVPGSGGASFFPVKKSKLRGGKNYTNQVYVKADTNTSNVVFYIYTD